MEALELALDALPDVPSDETDALAHELEERQDGLNDTLGALANRLARQLGDPCGSELEEQIMELATSKTGRRALNTGKDWR